MGNSKDILIPFALDILQYKYLCRNIRYNSKFTLFVVGGRMQRKGHEQHTKT